MGRDTLTNELSVTIVLPIELKSCKLVVENSKVFAVNEKERYILGFAKEKA